MGHALACPVCQARFRGASECSRCGADLTSIMSLAANAWRLRESARQAILDGDPDRSRALATQAQQMFQTSEGRRLEVLSEWLIAHRPSAAGNFDSPEILEGTIDSTIGSFDQMTLFAWPFEDT